MWGLGFSGSGAGSALADAGAWPLVLILSSAFPAGASIIKERLFRDAARTIKVGGGLKESGTGSWESGFRVLGFGILGFWGFGVLGFWGFRVLGF